MPVWFQCHRSLLLRRFAFSCGLCWWRWRLWRCRRLLSTPGEVIPPDGNRFSRQHGSCCTARGWWGWAATLKRCHPLSWQLLHAQRVSSEHPQCDAGENGRSGPRPDRAGQEPDHFMHFARLLVDSGAWNQTEFAAMFNDRTPPPTSKKFLEDLKDHLVKSEGNLNKTFD